MDSGATDCAGVSGVSAPRGQRGEKIRSEISSSFSYGQNTFVTLISFLSFDTLRSCMTLG